MTFNTLPGFRTEELVATVSRRPLGHGRHRTTGAMAATGPPLCSSMLLALPSKQTHAQYCSQNSEQLEDNGDGTRTLWTSLTVAEAGPLNSWCTFGPSPPDLKEVVTLDKGIR